jgi:predicted nucleic acid-binding protein|tara:strand:- start:12756 stop:13163 length:408 start_codon:yes stop_codon:yes gene_type:complete
MQIVIDTNPLISILINPDRPLFLLFLEELEIVAPELLFKEIENNKNIIIKKSKLKETEIDDFIKILKERIEVIPEGLFLNCREKAEKICPHEKDITYFALALYLKCSIWSNEKILKKQDHVVVYSTHELMKLFGL